MDYAYQGKHPPTQLAAMVAHNNANLENQDWLADSGANTHVTADHSNITDPQPFDGTYTIGVGKGASLAIQSIGSSLGHSAASHTIILFSKIYCIVPLHPLIYSP
jgi:hypothetical protein